MWYNIFNTIFNQAIIRVFIPETDSPAMGGDYEGKLLSGLSGGRLANWPEV